MSHRPRPAWSLLLLFGSLTLVLALARGAAVSTATVGRTAQTAAAADFPRQLVEFEPAAENPIFTAAGEGAWDAKIRERGWILRDGDQWQLWYTGYDGTREGIRQLGYATSSDGIHWQRYAGNPLVPGHWIEDMMVVRHEGTYYMFAEGEGDRAQLLTSADGIDWQPNGTLDVRYRDGRPLSAGPFGTPTVWIEGGVWYLFYERMDQGVWLAASRDRKVWTNIQDEPVLVPGPDAYDRQMIAMNQIVKHDGRYYAYYHGTGDPPPKRIWNTAVAESRDLVRWQKYSGNPILRDKSSAILIPSAGRVRLYAMHDAVDLFWGE